jgi:hypothetical protein
MHGRFRLQLSERTNSVLTKTRSKKKRVLRNDYLNNSECYQTGYNVAVKKLHSN